MQNKLENLARAVYGRYKRDIPKPTSHPDEEALAVFLENKLSGHEAEEIKGHLIACEDCARAVAMQIKMGEIEMQDVPPELLDWAKSLAGPESATPFLEIILRLKENFLEVLSTTGDVLVGQELMPAAVLRSRKIKDFKGEVVILKDFKDTRVEARIENKEAKAFSLTVAAKDKATQRAMKDLRMTLLKGDVELESYIASSGKVTFEHIELGEYTVEISGIDSKVATVSLNIKA